MQHISQILNKYKGLTMAQFNFIKSNNIQDFEVKDNLLIYKDKDGKYQIFKEE